MSIFLSNIVTYFVLFEYVVTIVFRRILPYTIVDSVASLTFNNGFQRFQYGSVQITDEFPSEMSIRTFVLKF